MKAIAEYANVPYTPPLGTSPEGYYTVQRGDTLYKIANEFNVSIDDLKKWNNLTSDNLQIGQVLRIAETIPNTSSTYIVQKGDTLYKIATQYNTTVTELKRINNLTGNTLFIGQELKIPRQSIGEENEPEDDNYTIYEVVKGDSLWLIAQKYGITVDELMELNNLTNANLQIGDKLKVPTIETESIYTVKNGDTLWSIAKANNTSVEELKQLNNLASNLLSVGQKLLLP